MGAFDATKFSHSEEFPPYQCLETLAANAIQLENEAAFQCKDEHEGVSKQAN